MMRLNTLRRQKAWPDPVSFPVSFNVKTPSVLAKSKTGFLQDAWH